MLSASGRLVRTLLRGGILAAGTYEVVWDGEDERGDAAPSGVSFARLEAGRVPATTRLVLIR